MFKGSHIQLFILLIIVYQRKIVGSRSKNIVYYLFQKYHCYEYLQRVLQSLVRKLCFKSIFEPKIKSDNFGRLTVSTVGIGCGGQGV